MPPNKEVEFVIELVSGTTPISIAPYHMALAKLKELKEQLHDLLSRVLIQPRVSPWESSNSICEEERWNHEIMYLLFSTR